MRGKERAETRTQSKSQMESNRIESLLLPHFSYTRLSRFASPRLASKRWDWLIDCPFLSCPVHWLVCDTRRKTRRDETRQEATRTHRVSADSAGATLIVIDGHELSGAIGRRWRSLSLSLSLSSTSGGCALISFRSRCCTSAQPVREVRAHAHSQTHASICEHLIH